MADLVLFEIVDRVAVITVNDPERRNAVTETMSEQLRDAVARAEGDEGVHAVVVTGAGKAFCAGADLSALGAAAREGLERIYAGFMAVGRCSLPTIAAVNGAAVGAGMNLALAAGMDAQFLKAGIEHRARPGDSDIGGQCQVHARAHRRAVDRRDGGQ